MKTSKVLILFVTLFSVLLSPCFAMSDGPIRLQIKIILASDKPGRIDPGLEPLARELRTVFRYSLYQLLGESRLSLGPDRTGSVTLPENRNMRITHKGVKGDRVTLELEILKGNSQIFQTVIRLKNRSSITLGGPEYQDGNLLFNIFTSF